MARITSRNGAHALVRPAPESLSSNSAGEPAPAASMTLHAPSEPGGEMAGFEAPSFSAQSSAPVPPDAGAGSPAPVAGFDPSEPGGEMAGFAPSNPHSRYLRTVSRSIPSSRAIRRWDQCIECNN